MEKNLPANSGEARDVGSILGSGRSLEVGNGNPFQYSCLENFMDRGIWWTTIHGVAESQIRLGVCAHTCTHNVFMWADSFCCTVETNTTV